MPYRIDIANPPVDVLDRFDTIEVLDLEQQDGTFSALIADSTSIEQAAHLLGDLDVRISPAFGRDDDSVWVLRLRDSAIGRWRFQSGNLHPDPDAIVLGDGRSFGTGLHPTTALCLEILDGMLEGELPASMLDIGTGSGILALAALKSGVMRVAATDIEFDALRETRNNAQMNGLERGLSLIHGGPSAIGGLWPLVFANILPAVLIDIAPALAARVAHNGRLVLSGIPETLAIDVERAYVRCGTRLAWSEQRAGWGALVFSPSW